MSHFILFRAYTILGFSSGIYAKKKFLFLLISNKLLLAGMDNCTISSCNFPWKKIFIITKPFWTKVYRQDLLTWASLVFSPGAEGCSSDQFSRCFWSFSFSKLQSVNSSIVCTTRSSALIGTAGFIWKEGRKPIVRLFK